MGRSPDSHQDTCREAHQGSFLVSVSAPTLSQFPISALIDSGASHNFVDPSIAPINLLCKLSTPILLHLFDGSPTHVGVITHSLSVDILVEGTDYKHVDFYVTPLHPLAKLVLGLFWLRQENPVINWTSLILTQQTPVTVGCNPTETYASIPELHTCAPIEAINVISRSCHGPIIFYVTCVTCVTLCVTSHLSRHMSHCHTQGHHYDVIDKV